MFGIRLKPFSIRRGASAGISELLVDLLRQSKRGGGTFGAIPLRLSSDMSTQHILQTAQDFLEQEGAQAFSMKELAERAGVSRSTLYRRIESKEKLLEMLENRGCCAPNLGDPEERILEATKKLIGREGRKDVTCEEVAEEACVCTVTVYRHFDNKRALLHSFAESVLPETRLDEILDSDNLTFEQKLRATAEIMVATMSEYPGLVDAYFLDQRRNDGLEPLRASRDKARRRLSELFEEAIKADKLKADSLEAPLSYFLSMATAQPALRIRMADNSDVDPAAEADRIVRLFLTEFGSN